jgi:hypothetical protein
MQQTTQTEHNNNNNNDSTFTSRTTASTSTTHRMPRIRFSNNNDDWWVLTQAFFIGDLDAIRKKKFFERWLKRNSDNFAKKTIDGASLRELRRLRHVDSSCNAATLVRYSQFDAIIAAFNSSNSNDSISIQRSHFDWFDLSYESPTINNNNTTNTLSTTIQQTVTSPPTQMPRIPFGANNDDWWVLTQSFFVDTATNVTTRKKFFERWLARQSSNIVSMSVQGAPLQQLRKLRYVDSSCNNATVVHFSAFDAIVAAFNLSKCREKLTVRRSDILWIDLDIDFPSQTATAAVATVVATNVINENQQPHQSTVATNDVTMTLQFIPTTATYLSLQQQQSLTVVQDDLLPPEFLLSSPTQSSTSMSNYWTTVCLPYLTNSNKRLGRLRVPQFKHWKINGRLTMIQQKHLINCI